MDHVEVGMTKDSDPLNGIRVDNAFLPKTSQGETRSRAARAGAAE